MAPLEIRLRAAVAKRLGQDFDAVTVARWIKSAYGDVPVFAVPESCVTQASELGLTVERVQA